MANPTNLVWNCDTEFVAQGRTGPVSFSVAGGTPSVSYREWGFGVWGEQGAWGQWSPKRLRLTGSESDAVDVAPSGIIDTYLGAICFKVTPLNNPSSDGVWGELGSKWAGTDHIRWGWDATRHPYVEWSGNDSAYTRVTLPGAVDAGDEHFYSIEWHVGDTSLRLYQDALPAVEGVIPSPQENYGGSNFVLESSDGTMVYSSLIISGDRLSDAQRTKLLAASAWSLQTIGGSAYRRIRPQFELRPY